MGNRLRLCVLSIVCMFLLAPPALAQIEQARLNGTVVDAQGAVLPGVTITVRSSTLIGAQTTVTEADGRFRFPAFARRIPTTTTEDDRDRRIFVADAASEYVGWEADSFPYRAVVSLKSPPRFLAVSMLMMKLCNFLH